MFLIPLITFLFKHFVGLAGRLIDFMKGVLEHVQDWAMSLLGEVVRIPELHVVWDRVGPYVVFANGWLPLDFAVTLALAWVSAYAVAIAVRITLKFIPFVG